MSSEPVDSGIFVAEHRELLARLPLCAGIPFELIEPFFIACEYRRLNPGDLLLSPGTPNQYLYILIRGEIVIYIDFLGSDKIILVPEGEFVGEVSLIDGLPPTGFVAAGSESFLLAIHEDTLWPKLFQIPGTARNFLQQLARRMRDRNVAIQKSVEQTLRLEYLEKELRIAHDLQASMLPMPPLLPGHTPVEIAALMAPAKEIGGDLYDAFALDANTICIAVGDVSGKGIPAALFMVRCLTLLRTQMLQCKDLLQTIHTVNTYLCDDNPTCMFVTLSICLVDLRNSKLDYVNGGHNPAAFGNFHEGFQFLAQPRGMMLGVNPTARYEQSTRVLTPGDILVLYTDGITEAMNLEQEEFSNQRLLDHLNLQHPQPVAELIIGIKNIVQEFAAGAQQSDDLTLLALKLVYENTGDGKAELDNPMIELLS